jgi:hypothetical protein
MSAGAAACLSDSAWNNAAQAGHAPDGHRAVCALLQVTDDLVVARLPGALRLRDLRGGLGASARTQGQPTCGGRCAMFGTSSAVTERRRLTCFDLERLDHVSHAARRRLQDPHTLIHEARLAKILGSQEAPGRGRGAAVPGHKQLRAPRVGRLHRCILRRRPVRSPGLASL